MRLSDLPTCGGDAGRQRGGVSGILEANDSTEVLDPQPFPVAPVRIQSKWALTDNNRWP